MVKESEQKKKETIQATEGRKQKGLTSRHGGRNPPSVGQLDPLV